MSSANTPSHALTKLKEIADRKGLKKLSKAISRLQAKHYINNRYISRRSAGTANKKVL